MLSTDPHLLVNGTLVGRMERSPKCIDLADFGGHLHLAVIPSSSIPYDLDERATREAFVTAFTFAEIDVLDDRKYVIRYRPNSIQGFLFRGRISVTSRPT